LPFCEAAAGRCDTTLRAIAYRMGVGMRTHCMRLMHYIYSTIYAWQGGDCVCLDTTASHLCTLPPPTNGDMNSSGGSSPFWGADAHLKPQKSLSGSEWYLKILLSVISSTKVVLLLWGWYPQNAVLWLKSRGAAIPSMDSMYGHPIHTGALKGS
jgi:hypothetical protein